jgi:hypothetical protein
MAATVEFQGGEPNGLAAMLTAIIESNLKTHPELDRLLRKRATYAIVAPDVDVAVSIRLSPGAVTVRNGVVGRPQVVVTGDSHTLVGMSAVPLKFGLPDPRTPEGRDVNRKLLRRQLRVKGMVRHAGKLARLNKLLTVT